MTTSRHCTVAVGPWPHLQQVSHIAACNTHTVTNHHHHQPVWSICCGSAQNALENCRLSIAKPSMQLRLRRSGLGALQVIVLRRRHLQLLTVALRAGAGSLAASLLQRLFGAVGCTQVQLYVTPQGFIASQ